MLHLTFIVTIFPSLSSNNYDPLMQDDDKDARLTSGFAKKLTGIADNWWRLCVVNHTVSMNICSCRNKGNFPIFKHHFAMDSGWLCNCRALLYRQIGILETFSIYRLRATVFFIVDRLKLLGDWIKRSEWYFQQIYVNSRT